MNNPTEQTVAGEINPISILPVYIEMYFDNDKLASGTAFFINSQKGPIFITNRHNVTGKHQETDEPLDQLHDLPNNIHFKIIGSHQPVWYAFDLFIENDFQRPIWTEHSIHGGAVDVVGILIAEVSNAIHRFVGIDKSWHKWRVGDRVHVIGYPFGMNDNFAIWSTGYIASEPDTNYKNLPSFLIDCRTRPGQSGSLVIARFLLGDVVEHKGKTYQAKKEMVQYLGIYSGRINPLSDLGIVWKMDVLRDIVKTIEANNKLTEVKCAYHRLKKEN